MAIAAFAFSQNEKPMRDMSGRHVFEAFVQFVLIHGNRQTYCNMYNNNPHYLAYGVEIYLNPKDQWINSPRFDRTINAWVDNLSYTVSDYDEILINDNNEKRCFRIRLIKGTVYMRDKRTDASNRLAKEALATYLSRMMVQ